MENRMTGRPFLPILIVFLVITLLIWAGQTVLAGWKTDYRVLLGGNGILLFVTGVSFYLYTRGLRNKANAYSFVRMMYGSLIVKMLVCLVAVLAYLLTPGPPNKNGMLGCFILYILYTYLEVKILTQLSRKSPKDA
jgi:ABC-type polysaccharide transport system permease subunit